MIAEGARAKGGDLIVKQIVENSPDPVRLGGVGKVLEQALSTQIDSEVRTTIPGHMQRGGTPTAYDRDLATVFGVYAAAMIAEGQFGRMVALQSNRLTSVPFEEIANKTRMIPLDHPDACYSPCYRDILWRARFRLQYRECPYAGCRHLMKAAYVRPRIILHV